MIVIVDYGSGNLASIQNMLKYLEIKNVKISSNIEELNNAKKIILPGVGAFDNGMKNLKKLNIIEVLNKKVLVDKIPFLGICLGMQLMTKGSEEGKLEGLAWIDAETKKFTVSKDFKVPHMGWNTVRQNKDSSLLSNISNSFRFYFVHSYYVHCNDSQDVLLSTKYNFDFTSAVEKDNMFGVQFHPEKSHRYGMQLIKNFADL